MAEYQVGKYRAVDAGALVEFFDGDSLIYAVRDIANTAESRAALMHAYDCGRGDGKTLGVAQGRKEVRAEIRKTLGIQ